MTYQEQALMTAEYGDANHEYPFVCLGEEVGEVLGKLTKFTRKRRCNLNDAVIAAIVPVLPVEVELREAVITELGDVYWNLAVAADTLGLTMEELGARNIEKLQGRVERGTIDGEGDNR